MVSMDNQGKALMSNFVLKQYVVNEDHLAGRKPLNISVPVKWLRENFKSGQSVGVKVGRTKKGPLTIFPVSVLRKRVKSTKSE